MTLGRGALDALGARIGQRVSFRVDGRTISPRVVGRHVEPDDEGRGAVTALVDAARRRGEARRALLGRPVSRLAPTRR